MTDPLTEHLIRATHTTSVAPARPKALPSRLDGHPSPTRITDAAARRASASPSAAPVRDTGTRVRAGNAMARTRAALLDGARDAVARYGTRVTMAQVALASGVAKATLYNHLRTREDVLGALTEHEVCQLAERVSGLPVRDALELAATSICEHPAVRHLAAEEPAVAAALAVVDTRRAGWAVAERCVRQALGAGSPESVDLVLRWLASFVLSPVEQREVRSQARLLAGCVTSAS